MRHFVGENAEDAAARVRRAGGGIEQQAAFEESDAAPILHGAAEAAGHRDQVELGERIFHAEIVIEIFEESDRFIERIAPVGALAQRGDDTDGDAVRIAGEPLELAGRQDEQIARHSRRALERDTLAAGAGRLFARDRHVGNRQEFFRHRHRELEARLEGGLVPARKDAARIRGLEVARQHPHAALAGRVVDHEQATAKSIDMRGEADAELMPTGGDGAREDQRDRLRRRIGDDLAGRTGVAFDGRRIHGHVHRVEHDPIGRLGDLDVDDLGAGDGELVQVRLQIERIVDRHHRLRQLAGRGSERKSRLRATASGGEQQHDQRADEQGCGAIKH